MGEITYFMRQLGVVKVGVVCLSWIWILEIWLFNNHNMPMVGVTSPKKYTLLYVFGLVLSYN